MKRTPRKTSTAKKNHHYQSGLWLANMAKQDDDSKVLVRNKLVKQYMSDKQQSGDSLRAMVAGFADGFGNTPKTSKFKESKPKKSKKWKHHNKPVEFF